MREDDDRKGNIGQVRGRTRHFLQIVKICKYLCVTINKLAEKCIVSTEVEGNSHNV